MISQKQTVIHTNDNQDQVSPQDVAAYTASMLVNLSRIAKHVNLNVLSYLLDMARLEAESKIK